MLRIPQPRCGWLGKKDFDKAIANLSVAHRLDPQNAAALMNRGWAWHEKGEFGNALVDFEEAAQVAPSNPDAYKASAWLMATCSDAKYRNGARAVELAVRACELGGWQRADSLQVLAAAYAETGDFDSAIRYQQKAIEQNSSDANFVKCRTTSSRSIRITSHFVTSKGFYVCPALWRRSRGIG